MTVVQLHSPFGSIIGGLGSDVLPLSCLLMQKKDENFEIRIPQQLNYIRRKFNFSEHLMLPRFLVSNADFIITYSIRSFPLSMVWIYKVRWWTKYKTILCSKANVEFFCITKTKKFTLHTLKQIEDYKKITVGPSTPVKREE